jgi:hypothetical protein
VLEQRLLGQAFRGGIGQRTAQPRADLGKFGFANQA